VADRGRVSQLVVAIKRPSGAVCDVRLTRGCVPCAEPMAPTNPTAPTVDRSAAADGAHHRQATCSAASSASSTSSAVVDVVFL